MCSGNVETLAPMFMLLMVQDAHYSSCRIFSSSEHHGGLSGQTVCKITSSVHLLVCLLQNLNLKQLNEGSAEKSKDRIIKLLEWCQLKDLYKNIIMIFNSACSFSGQSARSTEAQLLLNPTGAIPWTYPIILNAEHPGNPKIPSCLQLVCQEAAKGCWRKKRRRRTQSGTERR